MLSELEKGYWPLQLRTEVAAKSPFAIQWPNKNCSMIGQNGNIIISNSECLHCADTEEWIVLGVAHLLGRGCRTV